MASSLDPEAVRRLKEVLYRFLEELQTTRASLYLLASSGAFELVESFGFGRREAVLARVPPDHPLFHWIRRHRTSPALLTEPHREPGLGELLRLSGSSTLLTVPLVSNETLVGFVDARDRAGKKTYGPQELQQAKRIGEVLVGVLAELGVVSAPPPPQPAAEKSAVLPTGKFPEAVERLAAAVGALVQLPGISAVAVTLAERQTARCTVWAATTVEGPEREALLRHQQEFAVAQGNPLPPPDRWSWMERSFPTGELRREEIHSAMLSGTDPVVLVSILSPSGSPAVGPVLATLCGIWELAQAEQTARRAARNLARTLLEPGDLSFPHLRQHSQVVSELAQKMAQELSLSREQEELVTLAGYLHDVGMRELDYQRIYRLERPQELDRRLYQRHPLVGARILEASAMPGLAEAVRHHHERWDGTGYPQRLAGPAIPLASRIVHLAEVYDVLTSPSSYKRPMGREQALELIQREAGRQFDPNLVPILVKVLRS